MSDNPPPQKIIFGTGAVQQLAEFLSPFGWQRLLLVTTGSARRSGRAGQVEAVLGETLAASYDRVQPHVPAAQVEEALALAQAHGADAVVGLGGGSAIGLAKAVSYRLNAGSNGQTANKAAVPVIAIPTTY